jgi:DNA-binding transcriptional regulator GbsR (MarR family)
MSAAEPAVAANDRLNDLQERFILHWGEMTNAWGVNRTMGQIHALLYVSVEPLSTDAVMDRLKVSRGNASMNLRALEDWGLIQRVHFTGDRREYFRCITDVWEMFHALVRERKRREFDPTMRSLRQFLAEAEASESGPEMDAFRERVGNLLGLMQLLQRAADQFLPRDPHELPRLLEVRVEGLE